MPTQEIGYAVRTSVQVDIDPIRPAVRIGRIGIGLHFGDCAQQRVVMGGGFKNLEFGALE